MKLVRSIILFLALCSSFSPGLHAQSLAPFMAKYDAFHNGSKLGHAEMQLEITGENEYRLSFRSKVSIMLLSDKRSETSVFYLDQSGGLKPKTYQYSNKRLFKNSKLFLEFDAETNQIKRKGSDPINWQGEWDNQLYRLDLLRQIKSGKTKAEYKLINNRGQLRAYKFEVIGEEMLTLPFGNINAIKVKTIRSNKKRETYSWFAPDLDYMLVRLQQFKEGKEQGDIQLRHYVPATGSEEATGAGAETTADSD